MKIFKVKLFVYCENSHIKKNLKYFPIPPISLIIRLLTTYSFTEHSIQPDAMYFLLMAECKATLAIKSSCAVNNV